jgi:hypothetical protein
MFCRTARATCPLNRRRGLATLTNLEPLRPVLVAATLILLELTWRKLRQRSTPEKLTKATTPAGYPPTLKTK